MIAPDFELASGDVVTLNARVDYPALSDPNEVWVTVEGLHSRMMIGRQHLTLSSTHVAEGDEVLAANGMGPFGIVKVVIDGRAWVQWPSEHSVVSTSRLKRTRTAAQLKAAAALRD